MKKFTEIFLLGEHLNNVLRKIGLSMVAILMAVGAFAQAQETLDVWADDVSDCYRADNSYAVPVSMRDFVKIDTFSLVLNYDEDVFNYTGYSGLHTLLNATSTFAVTETTPGTLLITWDSNGDPVNNGTMANDDDTTVVFSLEFELDMFPEVYVYNTSGAVMNQLVKGTDLDWGACEYWNDKDDVTEILTMVTFDGSLTSTQEMADVVLDKTSADCYGGDATVTVTSPVGSGYAYNGPSFQSPASSIVGAPSTGNTVVVRQGSAGNYCISFTKQFDVAAAEELTFVAASPVEVSCPGGKGDIEILASGGTGGYTYYVIPSSEWTGLTGIKAALYTATTKEQANTIVAGFAKTLNILQYSPGTYYVCVQDANGCQDFREGIGLSASAIGVWKRVDVIDERDPWKIVAETTDAQCKTYPNGSYSFTIEGATSWADGYNIWVDNVYKGRGFDYDSGNIKAGSYQINVIDSLGCSWDSVLVVGEPDAIVFDLSYTDASCDIDNGTITIDTESIDGGSGDLADWWWVYSTSPDFELAYTDSVLVADGGVSATAEGLAPAVYYVRIIDATGCYADYKNENDDNAVKVLTTDFDLVYDDILCNGGTTDVSIVLETGSGNHTFKYGYIEGSGTAADTTGIWQTSNTFEDLSAGTYTFYVYDLNVANGGCLQIWTEVINEPTELMVMVNNMLTVPPTCPGNTDGNLVVWAWGGTPFVSGGVEYYEYKLDDNGWVQASEYNTFAIDTAAHEIYVRDANGCEGYAVFNWPNFENIIEFQDTIRNQCVTDKVNLFNGESWDDWFTGEWDWDQFEGVDLDWGFMQNFEWYGIPLEHYTGVVTFDYWFWTSDSGWFEQPVQGVQQLRNPAFYITSVQPTDGQDVVDSGEMIGHLSAYSAGTYWVVAKDEWGCFSNIEKIVILDPLEMEVKINTVAAGCDGSTDGKIMIEAFNGRFPIPMTPGKRYQYTLSQQPQIFGQENWWAQATWVQFANGNFSNDSLAVINVQDGTYWLAVRDYCAVEKPELIQIFGPIEVLGADAVEVEGNIQDYVTDVTCIIDGEEPVYDGSITGLLAATTGGFGGYTYTLEPMWKNGGIDWPLVNTTGNFTDLPGGTYVLTIEDDSLGCNVVYEVEIEQPDPLKLETLSVNPSCYNAHDGILRYFIYGGTAPYMEATNNVGMWENPADIPADRWVDVTGEAVEVEAHNAYILDRRVRAGVYQIWLKDANGCIYGPVIDTVEQPAALAVTEVEVENVSCNDQAELEEGELQDGSVSFMPAGGWNKVDGFKYYAELWSGATHLSSLDVEIDQLAEVTFSGLEVGDYTIKLYEYNESIWDNPIVTYTNYFTDHGWLDQVPYQNPYLTTADTDEPCYVTYNVTVGEPEPIVYDTVIFRDVKCHNTETGEIYVGEITGGTPGTDEDLFEGYLVGLEGPVDYHPLLQSNIDDVYDVVADGIHWFETGATNEFTFDNLAYGHYTIHIKDVNGCWIYKESGEIENPDTLQLVRVQLVENAKCYGGEGTIQIDAIGGVPPYKYAVDYTLVPNPGFHNFPYADEATYLASLEWQENDTFKVTAATWIGYVMDANECVVGYSTDENGNVIMHHRTTVLQSDPVEGDDFGQVAAECYGEDNGQITIGHIWGGNGGDWKIVVSGTDYAGNPVNKTFDGIEGSTDVVLTGLMASTTKTDEDDMTEDDWYKVVIYDSENCASTEYFQYVLQPEAFVIELKDRQNAFICPNDQAGLFEINVVSGGTPFGVGADEQPLYKYKWEAYSDATYSAIIDTLSDDIYGFTKTFLGYAGIYYRVWAIDANDCETSRDTFIQEPAEITFDVENTTCYGDTKGSASITAAGTSGRSFHVLYKEYKAGSPVPTAWTIYDEDGDNEWFASTIEIQEFFVYDNENLVDVHYELIIEDDMGCRSEIQNVTFDVVQHPLAMGEISVVETGECATTISVTTGTGGIPPYRLVVDGVAQEGLTATLAAGTYEITIIDDHDNIRCAPAAVSYDVVTDAVVRDTTVDVHFGDTVQFVDVEAGIDSMLAEGEYTFEYVVGECTRTLNVSVVGKPYDLTIAVIQEGTVSDSSDYIGKIVQFTGTVSAVAEGGFYVQDANAAWSGILIVSDSVVAEGDGVTVMGTVDEINKVTVIKDATVTDATAPLTVAPVVIASPEDAKDEMYESVLVLIDGARANAAGETGVWTVYTTEGNEVVIGVLLYTSVPVEGHFYDVTGVVDGAGDAYTVEPRKEADVVDLTLTGVVDPVEGLQFKVYPNPFNDRIMIDNNDKLTRVVVSNIAGQRVIDIEYPSHEIRTANLVSGVYVVSLITENGVAKTERMIKR